MRRKAFVAGRIAAGIAISIGLGWLTARGLDWSLVLVAFGDVSILMITLAVAVFVAASYLRAIRWRTLFVNGEVSTNRLFMVQNVGIGLNNLVPIRIASEAAQLAILSIKDRVRPSVALATLGMERVLDVVASALILAIAFLFIPEISEYGVYVWGALGLAILCVVLVRFLAWGGNRFSWTRRFPSVLSFAKAVRDLERERARLAASFAMSVIYWLLVGVTAWIISISFQLSITPMTATMVIMATIFFATAIPAAPSAIGSFEFAVVYLLGLFQVSHEPAFGFAVITHAVFFLPPTLMAVLFLPREGIGSISKLKSALSGRAEASTDPA
ncbi:MAG: lysylphosphatidylglycerol synthase transmembrane domain-containing protein [Dehalococcoidia bacterium]|nr:lysylphosphatidylglycerol synthase transmembrane domain-containing protein [Dehalococcoidia bacterium]